MITEIVKRATVCRQSQSRIHLLYPLTSTASTSIMLFLKHSFGILALHALLHAQQAFAEEDHTLFETEFRLMIMTGDPEHDMVTVEGEDGTMWPGNTEDDDKAGKPWYPGVKARDANGNWRMSYMAWSRPSEKERTMWHHHQGQSRTLGERCIFSFATVGDTS